MDALNLPRALIAIVVAAAMNQSCSSEDFESDSHFIFEELADQRGITFKHNSGASSDLLLPEIMGGGVAIADLNGDSHLDIYFVQSGSFEYDIAAPNELYLNDGQGQFKFSESGMATTGYGMGVAAGDYDNDGDVDLFITTVGQNKLLSNDGESRFTDVTTEAGFEDNDFSTAALFGDFDADGYLDLFVVNYVGWSRGTAKKCYDYATGARNYCDPANYDNPTIDNLYRNNGDGTFTDISDQLGEGRGKGNGLGAVATDFNGDGRLDIYVANDKTPNHLWLNQGELKFDELGFEYGAAMDDHGIAKAGMGVVADDIDNDQDADLIVVNIQGETDSVYRNDGLYFSDASAQFGLTRFSRNYTRFGIALADFTNDGFLDLYEGNGKVSISPEPSTLDPFAERNVLFLGTTVGRFEFVPSERVHSGELIHTTRGVAKGDLNEDGLIDLVAVNRDAQNYLLQNASKDSGFWLVAEVLERYGSPALHAKVLLESDQGLHTGEVQVGGSYLASNSPHIHFTFAQRPTIERLIVQWVDGSQEQYMRPTINQKTTLVRGQGIAVP